MKGREVSMISGVGNIVLALTIYFALGTLARSPAWTLLNQVTATAIMPALFLLAGVFQLAGGIFCEGMVARLGFVLAGSLMFMWAILTFASAPNEGGLTGAIFLAHIGILKLALAFYTQNYERLSKSTEHLAHEAVVELHRGE